MLIFNQCNNKYYVQVHRQLLQTIKNDISTTRSTIFQIVMQ